MLAPRTIGKIVVIIVIIQVLAFVIAMLIKDYYADKAELINSGNIEYAD